MCLLGKTPSAPSVNMPLLVHIDPIITGVDLLNDSTKVILDPPNVLGVGL